MNNRFSKKKKEKNKRDAILVNVPHTSVTRGLFVLCSCKWTINLEQDWNHSPPQLESSINSGNTYLLFVHSSAHFNNF